MKFWENFTASCSNFGSIFVHTNDLCETFFQRSPRYIVRSRYVHRERKNIVGQFISNVPANNLTASMVETTKITFSCSLFD